MFFKIGGLNNFSNFTGETPVLESLFKKVKKRFQQRYFLMKFTKFLRALF